MWIDQSAHFGIIYEIISCNHEILFYIHTDTHTHIHKTLYTQRTYVRIIIIISSSSITKWIDLAIHVAYEISRLEIHKYACMVCVYGYIINLFIVSASFVSWTCIVLYERLKENSYKNVLGEYMYNMHVNSWCWFLLAKNHQM